VVGRYKMAGRSKLELGYVSGCSWSYQQGLNHRVADTKFTGLANHWYSSWMFLYDIPTHRDLPRPRSRRYCEATNGICSTCIVMEQR